MSVPRARRDTSFSLASLSRTGTSGKGSSIPQQRTLHSGNFRHDQGSLKNTSHSLKEILRPEFPSNASQAFKIEFSSPAECPIPGACAILTSPRGFPARWEWIEKRPLIEAIPNLPRSGSVQQRVSGMLTGRHVETLVLPCEHSGYTSLHYC